MVHVNIELWYKEISSQEKACLLSIYWPNCLQKHVWGFMSASLVGAKYIYCLAKLAQNGESNVLTCNRALGGDSKTSWALSSPSRPTSVQAVGGGGVDNHLLEFFFIFLNSSSSSWILLHLLELTSFSDSCQAAPHPLFIVPRLERSKTPS